MKNNIKNLSNNLVKKICEYNVIVDMINERLSYKYEQKNEQFLNKFEKIDSGFEQHIFNKKRVNYHGDLSDTVLKLLFDELFNCYGVEWIEYKNGKLVH